MKPLNEQLHSTLSSLINAMRISRRLAESSKSTRRKVGAILYDEKFNTCGGSCNQISPCIEGCDVLEDENGKTKPEVIHAEIGALLNNVYSGPKTLVVTCAPCMYCAAIVAQRQYKINTVVFSETYRNLDGLPILLKANIDVLYLCEATDSLFRVHKNQEGEYVCVLIVGGSTEHYFVLTADSKGDPRPIPAK